MFPLKLFHGAWTRVSFPVSGIQQLAKNDKNETKYCGVNVLSEVDKYVPCAYDGRSVGTSLQ